MTHITGRLKKLASNKWGAEPSSLRMSAKGLVYSSAEYYYPVWSGSSHVHKVDVQTNNTLRIISEALKLTPPHWLPVLANIEPALLRREAATVQ